jgi:RNA polymerase sigma-70 factor (ECF subfamily)
VNEQEFTIIVRSTKKIVLGSVRKHLAARFSYATDDVVQETYLRGYRHLSRGKFRNESSLESWLYAIARNESFRMNKKLVREEEKAERSAEQQMASVPEQFFPEEKVHIEHLIDKLPEKYRQVMLLKAEGMPEMEIASRLRINEGTVKSRFFRGKEMLHKLFEEKT